MGASDSGNGSRPTPFSLQKELNELKIQIEKRFAAAHEEQADLDARHRASRDSIEKALVNIQQALHTVLEKLADVAGCDESAAVPAAGIFVSQKQALQLVAALVLIAALALGGEPIATKLVAWLTGG